MVMNGGRVVVMVGLLRRGLLVASRLHVVGEIQGTEALFRKRQKASRTYPAGRLASSGPKARSFFFIEEFELNRFRVPKNPDAFIDSTSNPPSRSIDPKPGAKPQLDHRDPHPVAEIPDQADPQGRTG